MSPDTCEWLTDSTQPEIVNLKKKTHLLILLFTCMNFCNQIPVYLEAENRILKYLQMPTMGTKLGATAGNQELNPVSHVGVRDPIT